MSDERLKELAGIIEAGDDEAAREAVRGAVDAGLSPHDILNGGLIAGMNTVGDLFKAHEIFLPDVLLAARAMQAGLDELRPLLVRDGVPSRGKVVLGTVQGDLHDIGKNLVAILLRGAGFEVVDLGNNVPPAAFVDTAEKENAGVIGMSALLTTTMPVMREVVDELRARGLQGRIRTVVGGAPVSEAWAREIGADGYGCDGAAAVDRVRALLHA